MKVVRECIECGNTDLSVYHDTVMCPHCGRIQRLDYAPKQKPLPKKFQNGKYVIGMCMSCRQFLPVIMKNSKYLCADCVNKDGR